MLTPLDIRQKEFKKGFRGYDEREIDNFIEEVADTVERLLQENHLLKEKLKQSEERHAQYRELEEVLKNTMIMAQKNAQELKENTDKEIQVMMKDAYQRAEKIMQDAELESKRMIAEAEEKVKELMEQCRQIQKQTLVYRTQLRSFLEAQLDLLNSEENSHPINIEAAEEEKNEAAKKEAV